MSEGISEVRVELNDSGIIEMLNSQQVQSFLLQAAQRMANNAEAMAPGAVFEASVQSGKKRARASVITANRKAREAEAQARTLTRSIDSARG